MRGVYASSRGRAPTYVGASILQTPGAQAREMGQIEAEIRAFSGELTGEARRRHYDVHDPASEGDMAAALDPVAYAQAIAIDAAKPIPKDPLVAFFADVWTPWVKKWGEFYREYGDGRWWSNPAAEAEGYQRELVDMRARVAALGHQVQAPAPQPFSPSVFDPHHDLLDTAKETAQKAGEKAGEAWTLVKVGIYGALAIGGIIALSSVAHDLRSGRDPAEKYLALARRSR